VLCASLLLRQTTCSPWILMF